MRRLLAVLLLVAGPALAQSPVNVVEHNLSATRPLPAQLSNGSAFIIPVLDTTLTARFPAGSTPADNENNAVTITRSGAFVFTFDGSTWDRWTGAVSQAGTWNLGTLTSITNPVAVTGTFWQATQPISGTVDTELPTASVPADTEANIVAVPRVGSFNFVWNGGQWDRMKGNATTGTDVDIYATAQADYDTGAGTVGNTMLGIALPGSGGPVAGGTSTNPVVVSDPNGAQEATLNALVQATKAEDQTHLTTDVGIFSLNVANEGGAAFSATDLDYVPIATDLRGRTLVRTIGTDTVVVADGGGILTVDGTVDVGQITNPVTVTDGAGALNTIVDSSALPTGASTLAEQQTQTTALQIIDNLPLAQGSTTSGQSGPLVQGAVTTGDPTYTTGQTSPLSLTTDGKLRVAGSFSGGGDGAIQDGVTASIEATVFDFTNSNPLGVVLRDTNGDYVSVGGGTQYAEDTPSADAQILTMTGAVRQDTPTTTTTLDGDRSDIKVDSVGRLWVNSSGVTQPVSGTFWQATQPISAASLPLPTGAATEATLGGVLTTTAHDAAFGTAGTADAQVRTVQGIAGGTAVPVSGTFWQATQPVSGTVTANAGTGTFAVSDPSFTDPTGGTVPANAAFVAGTDGTNTRALKTDAGGELQIDVLSAPTTAVTGTFWQTTQPVSIAAAVTVAQATAANLNATVTDGSGALTVDGTVTAAQATAANLNATVVQATGTNLHTVVDSGTVTTVTTVGTVTNLTNLPNEGQQTAANSISVAPDTDNDAIGATGAAPPGEVVDVGGRTSGADTTGLMTGLTVCTNHVAVDIVTATTTLLITGVANRHVRICSGRLVTTGANCLAFIAGTGATCGTSTAGMNGGTTAAEGECYAANGGFAQGTGIGEIMSTKVSGGATGDSVCIITSAATQLSGTIAYAIY